MPFALVLLLLAQAPQSAELRVTVVDQTGGGVPHASVRVTRPDGTVVDVSANDRGVAVIETLPVGVVQLHVEFSGFLTYDSGITLRPGSNDQRVTLALANVQEAVVVTDTTATDDRRGNAMTTTLEEEDIAELSDDPEELQAQLEALAGGDGAVFDVDGFRGGGLPNRDDIRQIRFRTNSFAADNHDAGRTRVEIVTRPGQAEWRGNANLGLRTDVLNARNAFARAETPEQYRRFNTGIRGPLVENRTSLRVSVSGNRSYDTTPILALTPAGEIAGQVRRPSDRTEIEVGVDHGLSTNNMLRVQYETSRNRRENLGVGDINLAERAYTRSSDEQQARVSLQSVIGRSLNSLRVQYNTEDSAVDSISNAPAVIVIDAFSRGGAGQYSRGTTRTLEVADDYDFTVGRHAMRVGALLEAEDYRNSDARNAAGTFTFASLEALEAGRPNTFTQRLGQLDTAFTQYQLGLYWQDDVRLNRSLTVSVGLRQEMQNHLDDWLNVMPRLGFSWNVGGARTVVRGGYGLFHDWYESSLYDETLRVDGDTQTELLILNPGYPDPIGGESSVVLPDGRVQAAGDLTLPYVHQASIGIERPILPSLNVQASYLFMRGRNQFRARNVNAPDAFGVRPEPGIGTVTQIESTGRSATDRLNVNLNYRMRERRIFMNVRYTVASTRNMGDNPLALPANSFDPDAEWGPSAQDIRHRLNAMLNLPLGAGFRASIISNSSSAPPYTITTGGDDNRDGVSNDRPAGIGRNTAREAARWELSTRITKTIGFGGARGDEAAGAQGGGPTVVRQGRGGRGGGRGGFFGDGDDQRFRVELYINAFNVLNRTNYLNFSGNQQSPRFQSPTSAGQARRVEVGMQFRF